MMVDFKVDALLQVNLNREPPEVGLEKNVNRKFVVQHVPTLHRECYCTLLYICSFYFVG